MPVTISTTKGNVTLFEMWESFKKGIDLQEGPYVEQTYVVSANDWNKTDAVINAMMGGTSSTGGAGGPAIRIPGFPCPTSPNLTCVECYLVGEAENCRYDGGHVTFNLPKIKAKYGIRSWAQLANDDPGGQNSFDNSDSPGSGYTYASMSIDFGEETLKLPSSAYHFGSPTLATNEPFSRRIGVATLTFERHRVPYLPTRTILPLLSRVNNATFFGAPAGQMLFVGARTSKVWESDGTIVQDVTVVFKYREFEWNRFPRPDTGAFDYLLDNAGNKVYTAADLKPLLLS